MKNQTALVKGSAITKGKRELTVLGASARTANECSPFGDDSCPPLNATAVMIDTHTNGDPFIIGMKNQNQVAAPGEKRLYSVDADGNVAFYAWIKADGTLELGGNEYHLVRYEPLAEGLNIQNTQIVAELGKISLAIGLLGGTYTPGAVGINITEAKIDEIKTI